MTKPTGSAIEPLLVNIWPDAGQALGVGRSTVYGLVRSGELPSVYLGRRRLVSVAALREFTERLARGQTQGAT